MADFTETQLKKIWEKGRKYQDLNPEKYRLDACGALIQWDSYGKETPFGWEVDHIFPCSMGGGDEYENLRPLHYANNRSKSNDYPSYVAEMKFDGKSNAKVSRPMTVNAKKRALLKTLYPKA